MNNYKDLSKYYNTIKTIEIKLVKAELKLNIYLLRTVKAPFIFAILTNLYNFINFKNLAYLPLAYN